MDDEITMTETAHSPLCTGMWDQFSPTFRTEFQQIVNPSIFHIQDHMILLQSHETRHAAFTTSRIWVVGGHTFMLTSRIPRRGVAHLSQVSMSNAAITFTNDRAS